MQKDSNIKDTEKTGAISLPAVRANPFGENISAEKAYRRAERIAAAIYILTRHVSDSDTLKSRARESSHVLLHDVLGLRSGFRMESGSDIIASIHALVREMISTVQLLSVAGYSSKENAGMVTRALEELSQFVDSASTTTLSERTVFTRDDLLIDQMSVRTTPRAQFASSAPQGAMPALNSGTSQGTQKHHKGQVSISDSMSGRKSAILEVLKDGKKMAIKDIASFVVGCSEKTIQRELAALVSDGIIRREGEKRWSRYFVSGVNR